MTTLNRKATHPGDHPDARALGFRPIQISGLTGAAWTYSPELVTSTHWARIVKFPNAKFGVWGPAAHIGALTFNRFMPVRFDTFEQALLYAKLLGFSQDAMS